MLRRVVANGVLMPAQRVDRISADAQARPRNIAAINRAADRSIGRASTFRPHIALGGEASHQVVPRTQRGHDGPLRHRLQNGLQVFLPRMQEKMNMRIDQPRQQRAISEIDDLRARRMLYRRADFDDAVAFDQNFARLQDLAAFNVEQTRRMQHDYLVRVRGLRPARTAECESENQDDYSANSRANHGSERDDITLGRK